MICYNEVIIHMWFNTPHTLYMLYSIGDGAGVGKGRTIAGKHCLFDWWCDITTHQVLFIKITWKAGRRQFGKSK